MITKGQFVNGQNYHISCDGSWINEIIGATFTGSDGRKWYISHAEPAKDATFELRFQQDDSLPVIIAYDHQGVHAN